MKELHALTAAYSEDERHDLLVKWKDEVVSTAKGTKESYAHLLQRRCQWWLWQQQQLQDSQYQNRLDCATKHLSLNQKDIFQTFKWVLDGLWEDGDVSKKTIIFCRTKNNATRCMPDLNRHRHQNLLIPGISPNSIDIQGVHTIVQYGPPHDMEEYIQESGRAGRDGKDSIAILVSYPGAATLRRPDTWVFP